MPSGCIFCCVCVACLAHNVLESPQSELRPQGNVLSNSFFPVWKLDNLCPLSTSATFCPHYGILPEIALSMFMIVLPLSLQYMQYMWFHERKSCAVQSNTRRERERETCGLPSSAIRNLLLLNSHHLSSMHTLLHACRHNKICIQ